MVHEYLAELFGLSGQVAVVIGGTGVLGGALAEGLARAGATVVIAGGNADRGSERVERIRQRSGHATFTPADVTQRGSLETLLATTVSQFGRVDMLVNCAGVNSAAAYLDVSDDDWQRVLDVNLRGTHWACQIFGGHMVGAGGGAILNIASVTADRPLSRVFAYSASKAAVVNLTQNVARELAPHGVRVNALCPGFFPAEQNRAILDERRVTSIISQTPLARFGEPEELIGATLLLLSRKAGSFITGASFYVDGGFSAMRF
ncbi:MAG TPA: SDR family oxidoreductase [Pirellulales bacterium]|jgi:NAD(P)-dependent dehydrogenase (short-subunit alcohol dehydrogenase family)|nr:SDR family oxidoreductase [Pirellulales bacterium]